MREENKQLQQQDLYTTYAKKKQTHMLKQQKVNKQNQLGQTFNFTLYL